MKLTLRKRVMILVVLFAAVINVFCIALSYRNFINTNVAFGFSTANTVAKTCVLVIDSDRIQEYTASLQRDSDYYETWNKLIDYKNTNEEIVDLSMIYFTENGCHYIFDTNLTKNGAFLGDFRKYDILQERYKKSLMMGTYIGYIKYGNRIDVYEPVLNSFDIPVGYVVVGFSTEDAVHEQLNYLIRTIIILSLATLLLCLLVMVMFNRTVILPINLLSEAAANYEASIDKVTNTSALSRLQIKTGDEIENLSRSMKKMEKDILNSAAHLAIANWNSYHDSMTQLYNNRHLSEHKEQFKQFKTVGGIFFDIDNLKKMNDTCGHETGDEIIKKAAAFINKYNDTLTESNAYRLGGDEFLLIIGNCTKEFLQGLVTRMREDPDCNLSEPGQPIKCRIAIGSSYLESDFNLDHLVKFADRDMYRDKKTHRQE